VLSEIQYFYEVGTPIEENTTAYYRVDVRLDGETVSGLVEYNSTVEPQPLPPIVVTEAAQLYTKCMPCHGVYGEQSAYGVTVAINTMDATTLKTALSAYKAGSKNVYGYGDVMHAQVDTMSDDQLTLLSQYIPTLTVPDTNTTQP
jgi:cytochrome c553